MEAARSFPKNFYRSFSILDCLYQSFLSLSIFFISGNSQETLSSQNHRTLRIFSTAVVDPKEEPKGPGPLQLFMKNKDSTHTFNNNGQNCMECKLIDPRRGHMRDHRLLDDIATSIV